MKIIGGIAVVSAVIGGAYGVKRFIENRQDQEPIIKKPLSVELSGEFEKMVNQNGADVYRFIRSRVDSEYSTDELMQKTLLRAYAGFEKFKPKTGLKNPPRSWLFKIADNLIKNYYRDMEVRNRREIVLQEEHFEHLNSYSVMIHSQAEDEVPRMTILLREAIRQLPSDEYRAVIWLKYIENLTNMEIGQILGKRENAVKSIVHRLEFKLREIITDLADQTE